MKVLLCLVVVALVAAAAAESQPKLRSYYDILNVEQDAQLSSVKRNYRRLTKLYHPDSHSEWPEEKKEVAEKIYMKVSTAYETLSDANKRGAYDRLRSATKERPVVEAMDDYWDYDWNEEVGYSLERLEHYLREEASWGVLFYGGMFILLSMLLGPKLAVMSRDYFKARRRPPTINERLEAEEKKKKKAEAIAKEAPAVPKKPRAERLEEPELEFAEVTPEERPEVVLPTPAVDVKQSVELRDGLEWLDDEMSRLAKAIVRYPGGVQDRWDKISEFIGTRSPKEVAKKVKEQKQFAAGPATVSSAPGPGAVKRRPIPANNVNESAIPPEATESAAWTIEEQKLLEEALVKYPTTAPERWTSIGNHVGTKTKKQCIQRFKELAARYKNGAP